MSKMPRAMRQGIRVVSWAEYKNIFLRAREDNNATVHIPFEGSFDVVFNKQIMAEMAAISMKI